jgi:hypothetical protein
LLEAVRPKIDGYLLALLRDQVFTAADFHEDARGACRLLPPLTHELAQTLPAWRELIAPVAEHVARLFLGSAGDAISHPTPLSQANRRADRARRHQRPSHQPAPSRPSKLEPRCKRCGGELPHRDRVYCDDCLPHYQRDRYEAFVAAGRTHRQKQTAAGIDPSHGGPAGESRAANRRRRRAEQREWEASHTDRHLTDPEWFARELLPALQQVPLYTLARATGLSNGYVSQIRRGLKTPHPRHWAQLAAVAGVADG